MLPKPCPICTERLLKRNKKKDSLNAKNFLQALKAAYPELRN